MTIALAAAWHPRGELPRFERLLPALAQVYQSISISLPPFAEEDVVLSLRAIANRPASILTKLVITDDWRSGRYESVRAALMAPSTHVQYADLDRLLRWVETRPLEWRKTTELVQASECMVIGRTLSAYASHPRSLVETEAISNQVASHIFGRAMDFSAGSKAFIRAAAQYLVENSNPLRAMGSDAEWPILALRAGFVVDYIEVDGLDWEIADHQQSEAASIERQQRLAEIYDADPAHWSRRAAIALEIVQSALEASQKAIRL